MWLTVLVLFTANRSKIPWKSRAWCVMAMSWVCRWIGARRVESASPAVSCTRPRRLKLSVKRTTNYSVSTASWATGTKIMKLYQLRRRRRNTAPSSASTKKPQQVSLKSSYLPRTRSKGTYSWWNFKRSRIEENSAYSTMLSEICSFKENRPWRLIFLKFTRKKKHNAIPKLFKSMKL